MSENLSHCIGCKHASWDVDNGEFGDCANERHPGQILRSRSFVTTRCPIHEPMTPQDQTRTQDTTPDLLAEMNEALQAGALFNPEMFGAMLKAGDNPILRWRDALAAERASHAAELKSKDAEIARAGQRAIEEHEAALCPEDVGCADLIATLRAEICRLKARERDTQNAFLNLMAYVRGESPSLLTDECVDAYNALEAERAYLASRQEPSK